jgi:SAM-dependent methyltransferase
MTSLLGKPCGVLKCAGCGLVYKELTLTPNGLARIYSETYVHFQSGSDTASADINSARQKLDRCRRLLPAKRTPRQIRLLDVGCGSGAFVEIARQFGYQAEGIDPNLPKQEGRPFLQRKSPAEVTPCSYDVALLLNVAEHLVEPRSMFAAVRRLLKPHGVLLLTCPYGDSLARRVHQNRWGHLALEEHLLFWTPDSLGRMLRMLGFQGRVSYRIAGSPFPYGRCEVSSERSESDSNGEQSVDVPATNNGSWQKSAWQLARAIQSRPRIANAVRSLVHLSRTGDYLEYAIAIGR